MVSIRSRRLADGSERHDVIFSRGGHTTSLRFTELAEAEGYAHVVALGQRRCWPLAPLEAATGQTARQLAHIHGVKTRTVQQGLTDMQADQWATAAGLHPTEVWGWAWVTAATPTREQPPSDKGEAVA